MKRLILAAGLAGLAVFPAGALAGPSRSKVLSVDTRHHTVQLVDSAHLVHAYRYRGKLPRLGRGDSVSYRRSGHTISRVNKTARAFGTISFYAKVVRSGSRKVRLRLGDGSGFSLSSKQVSSKALAHAAAVSARSVTLQIQGLAPGQTVLISETVDARGHWTITITLPSSSTAGAGPGTTSGGDSGGGSGGGSGDDQLAEGTITQISDTKLAVSTSSGALSFSVDPTEGLTEGFLVGDAVDVSYFQNSDGTLSADDVEYVEQDATGVVSAVSDASLTLVDDATGQPDTFSGDPDLGLFDGVTPGDEVDVTYHQSAAGLVADAVGDDAWGG
jgi:uncharacterized protein DUF5666